MRILLGTALLATACGGAKQDPYAASLAQGSEHVDVRGTVRVSGRRIPFTATGDFTNNPDRGAMTLHLSGKSFHEVVTTDSVYLELGKGWQHYSAKTEPIGMQTPAQIFRAQLPARSDGGLVRHVDVTTRRVTMSIDFSRYGEPVRVRIPRNVTNKPRGLL